jgi:hypothetical protein
MILPEEMKRFLPARSRGVEGGAAQTPVRNSQRGAHAKRMRLK